MVIERENDNIIIKLDSSANMKAIQKIIDYFNLVDSIPKNQGTEEQVAELARESHLNWIKENQHRLSK
jgi:hypothetical protein